MKNGARKVCLSILQESICKKMLSHGYFIEQYNERYYILTDINTFQIHTPDINSHVHQLDSRTLINNQNYSPDAW